MRERIVWTEYEQDTLFTATIAFLKEKPRTKVHDAVRLAQVVLPETRRRKHLAGVSQLPEPMRQRFITVGALSKEWRKQGGKGKLAPQLVPVEELDQIKTKVRQLEEEKQALEGQLATAREEAGQMAAHITALENRPTFVDALRDFVADSLAEAVRRSRAVPGGAKDGATLDIMKGFFRAPQYGVGPQKPKQHQPEPEAKKDAPPKNVVVVGIRHDEEQKLNKHFEGKARIRYWRDGRTHTLEELARHAEIVFINRATTGVPIVEACTRTGHSVQEVPTSGDRLVAAIEHFILHPEAYKGGGSATHN